jgi:hypothetical protein
MHPMLAVLLALPLCLLPTAGALAADDPPAASTPEQTYDAAVAGWHRDWTGRSSTQLTDRGGCLEYWQQGDPIRERMRATPPPPARAEFHRALVAFVDAALAAADECLAEPRPTPKWSSKVAAAIRLHQKVYFAAGARSATLPTQWL